MTRGSQSRPRAAKGALKQVPPGWKQVSSTTASTLYTFPLPKAIKDRMIAASKEPRVLSTGAVFVGHLSGENGRKS